METGERSNSNEENGSFAAARWERLIRTPRGFDSREIALYSVYAFAHTAHIFRVSAKNHNCPYLTDLISTARFRFSFRSNGAYGACSSNFSWYRLYVLSWIFVFFFFHEDCERRISPDDSQKKTTQRATDEIRPTESKSPPAAQFISLREGDYFPFVVSVVATTAERNNLFLHYLVTSMRFLLDKL